MEHGALPIFCTIPGMSFEIYNKYTLSQGSTTYLKYTEQYTTMQEKLNKTLEIINSKIHKINKKINVATPFIHETIRERRGRKNRRYYTYSWDKFIDGLHAPSDPTKPMLLLTEWMNIILNAIKINEGRHENTEEEGSPKRSWRCPPKRPRVE